MVLKQQNSCNMDIIVTHVFEYDNFTCLNVAYSSFWVTAIRALAKSNG